MPALRRLARRLTAGLGIALLSLLLLELYLQLAALLVGGERGASPGLEGPSAAGLRVACLGDSNTFGLYFPESDSYPRQLEARWNETHPEPIEVVNLGYPGANSSRLLAHLDRTLDEVRPDLAIVMIGVNDFWTRPVEQAHLEEGAPLAWLAERSRLYRAWLIHSRGRVEPALAVEAPDGTDLRSLEARERLAEVGGPVDSVDAGIGFEMRKPGEIGWQESLAETRANLLAIAALARRHDVDLIVMTYPANANVYAPVNGAIRALASEHDLPLVDLARLFAERCPTRGPCDELLVPDGHPTPAGYAVVADAVAAHLAERALPASSGTLD